MSEHAAHREALSHDQAVALPVVDRRVSHLGPGVEEIQSLDEVVNPGSQGLARLVGVFL